MKGKKKIAQIFAIALALMVMIPMAVAQMPMPVTVQGTVTYANGTFVPAGWGVTMENLDEVQTGEPWTTTTELVTPNWNYILVGTATNASTFRINVSDPAGTYTASETFSAAPMDMKTVNITVSEVPPIPTPSPTPTLTPSPTPSPTPTPTPPPPPPPPPIPSWVPIIIGVIVVLIIVGVVAYYYTKKRKT